MRIPKSGEFYRHFKNKLYQIVAVAEHSENGEKLVIYQALYGDFKIYARPLEMFISEVDHEKYPEVKQKYRFMRVDLGSIEEESLVKKTETVALSECKMTERVMAEEVLPQNTEAKDAMNEVTEIGDSEPEEGFVEPGFLEFLDEESWDQKYNILVSLRDKMTDSLVDNLAVAMDVVIPEGPLDKRYEQLKICLRTRQKYESQHLR